MAVSLSPDLQRQIEERVESGGYDSAEEVVRRAMWLLSKEEQEHAVGLNALRAEIQEGIDDLENGRHSPKSEVFARLRARRGRAPA